jgi:phosphate transport system protein
MNTQPHDHIVKSYDEEQRRLLDEILRMGEMAASQLEAALDVIERRDDKAAERIIGNDEAIDALEHEVSHDVMKLALRGPLARDLRQILAALRIAADIERIGDYASNLAKRSMALNLAPPLPHTRGLGALGALAVQQVRDVLKAYGDSDATAAQRVRARDAELDTLYTGLFRELLTYMMEDARAITPCTHLLFMAKNIERIGDHATNIAENVWFQVHGEGLLPPREKARRDQHRDVLNQPPRRAMRPPQGGRRHFQGPVHPDRVGPRNSRQESRAAARRCQRRGLPRRIPEPIIPTLTIRYQCGPTRSTGGTHVT